MNELLYWIMNSEEAAFWLTSAFISLMFGIGAYRVHQNNHDSLVIGLKDYNLVALFLALLFAYPGLQKSELHFYGAAAMYFATLNIGVLCAHYKKRERIGN